MTRLPWILAAIATSALAQPIEHELAPAAPPPLDAAPAPVPATPIRLVLSDGQSLQCELLAETEGSVTVRVGDGAPFEISRASIRSIEYPNQHRSSEDPWFRDTNATRYLYSPTGFMLRQGEGYLSQKELVVSSFGYGLTDHLTVTVGSAVPAWLYGQLNVGAAIKAGTSVSDHVHLAVGLQGLLMPSSVQFGALVAHGTLTYGTPRLNATLTAGGMFGFSSFGSGQATTVISVGALYRMTPNVALETEHLLFPQVSSFTGEPFLMFNGAGLRLMVEHWALDMGILRIPGPSYPVPWLDLTYSFGP